MPTSVGGVGGGGGVKHVDTLPPVEDATGRLYFVRAPYTDDDGNRFNRGFYHVDPNTNEWREGFGGVLHVDQLPSPVDGRGAIYYVPEPYLGSDGPWLDEEFNLTLTPADVRSGGTGGVSQALNGYTSLDSQVYGNFVDPGGSVEPLPPGLTAIFIGSNSGVMYLKMEDPLLSMVGRVHLTVSYGNLEYVLAPAVGSAETNGLPRGSYRPSPGGRSAPR